MKSLVIKKIIIITLLVIFGVILLAELVISPGLLIAAAMSFDGPETLPELIVHILVLIFIFSYPISYVIGVWKSVLEFRKGHPSFIPLFILVAHIGVLTALILLLLRLS